MTPRTHPRLVLFDIDGTLLWSDGAGRRAMDAALLAVFGSSGNRAYRFDGKTDPQIVRELMRDEGHDDDAINRAMPRVIAEYLSYLDRELTAPHTTVRLLDGVADLLAALRGRGDCVLGLLTGNLEHGAARKLAAVGVDAAGFTICAYGSDHEVREELPAVAQRRARELLGLDLPGASLVIIGDTPADIACGRGLGARAIAVATGRYRVEELAIHRPWAVFPDLRDTAAVTRAIFDA